MSSQSSISNHQNTKSFFLFAGFFAILLATSVVNAEELSREKAADLISLSLDYPKHEQIVIDKSYEIKREIIEKWYRPGGGGQARTGICYYGGLDFTDSRKRDLHSLQKKGLLTVGEKQIQGKNCITTAVRVDLTETGRQYLLKETEKKYTLRASDIVLDQVTGIVRAEGSVSARADYTESRKNQTPFFELLDSRGNPHRFKTNTASFLLYDDGWRVKK